MRPVLKVVAVLGALCALVVLWALAWFGAFDRVSIEERMMGPYTIVYRESSSTDQREVGRITTELHAALAGAGITRAAPFDAFRPDGRNDIGFCLNAEDTAALARLDPSLKRRTIEAAPSMTARFPWRSPLSFVVGALKINAALRGWRAAHGYAKTVAYVINEGASTIYVQPIAKAGN